VSLVALAYRFKNLGFAFDRNDIDELYQQFLHLADDLKAVEDENLSLLANTYLKMRTA
jgi:2-isopropylmalate synthase